jgi:hypothetical protein
VQNHLHVPKITKMDAFSLIQSQTSIFHDERASSASFPSAKKARTMRPQSPKFTMVTNKAKKARRHTDKKPNSLVCKNLKIQKLQFQRTSIHKLISGATHCDYADRGALAPLTTLCAFFARFESEI